MTQYTMTPWSDDYAIGIEMIDEQHKKFFRLARHFWEDCLADEGEERIKSTLAALGHYANKHFLVEESFMEEKGYPFLDDHKIKHAQFIELYKNLDDLLKKHGPKEVIINETLSLLMDWLKEHIVNVDGEYAKHFDRND
jgi:hemerythrin